MSEPVFGVGDASFRAAGGKPGIERLVDDFYRIMDESDVAPNVRCLYPQDLAESRERLASFLCGWLGGPRYYAEKYGSISVPLFHRSWSIGEQESREWLACMDQAIARQPYSKAFADYLLAQLCVPALRIVQANPQQQADR